MPTLAQSLPANDLGFLRIVAALWGIELIAADPAQAAVELAETLCDAQLLEEVVSTLPEEGQNALGALADAGGRLPWVVFTRRFGAVREMGAAKRDREQPHERPNSPAELLWYRALLAKAFFDTEKGPQEFAYIPDDLRQALEFIGFAQSEASPAEAEPAPAGAAPLKPPPAPMGEILGRPASPGEKAHPLPLFERLLDDATTLLAALRLGLEPPPLPIALPALLALLEAAEILQNGQPLPAAVKSFLELPRPAALTLLEKAWRSSQTFDELRLLPGLFFEGGWTNDALATRNFILPLIEALPAGQWWSLGAFVRDFKTRYADFQRPAPGDYDSWFIKRAADGVYLRGFDSWDEVEGALLRFFISGPLFWLGRVEISAAEEGGAPAAFRLRAGAAFSAKENGKVSVTSQGKIVMARPAPRAARYQIARFCEWEAEKEGEYRYHISAGSLKRAAEQGLKVNQLLSLLAKHSGGQLPPVFVKMLQRWELNGIETRLETLTVLRVSKPAVLEELRRSKAGRFLGEILGPTTVKIPAEAIPQVLAALAELGLLAEVQQG
ncbi:MAG: hypothetical protein OHK0031_02720 [Anaerolineales bacterium]